MTDDHGAWANACYGNHEVQTHILDKLAESGIRFNRAYTPTPVCSPARACLLTGKTASQIGIHDWLAEFDEAIANHDWLHGEKTLFNYFHDVGYRTGLSGKWHLGHSHQTPDGADFHFGLPGWQGKHNHEYEYVYNGERITLDGNKSSHITDYAIEFLNDVDNDPFFLNVGYIATHSPYAQQEHAPEVTALYQDSEFVDILPYAVHPWVKNEGTPNHPTDAELRDRYIGYYASVTEIDNNISRIYDTLQANGQLENTIIIYTSDHGCAIGHHGLFGKGNSTRPLNMYEKSLHVPLIISGAGIATGQVSDLYVDHYDTFRTILDLANIELSDASDFPGTSYSRLLVGETIEWDNTQYGEYGDLRMIRNEQWKLVWRYPDGPHSLFNLIDDPDEVNDLARSESQQSVMQQLKARLDSFYAVYSDDMYSGLRVRELPRHNLGAEAWRMDKSS